MTAAEIIALLQLAYSFVQLAVKEAPQLMAVGKDIISLVESAINGTELTEEEKEKIQATQDFIDAALKSAIEERLKIGNLEA